MTQQQQQTAAAAAASETPLPPFTVTPLNDNNNNNNTSLSLHHHHHHHHHHQHHHHRQERIDIDGSISPCCWLLSLPIHCGFCPYQTILRLEKEEAIRQDTTLCGQRTSHRPYGELGQVETSLFCCLVCVDSNLQTVMPGFGCHEQQCRLIENELKKRMKKRGDTAQIQLAEAALYKASEINRKVDIITNHLLIYNQQQQHHQQGITIIDMDVPPPPPIKDAMDDR